jgi:hypothetical protein
VLTGVRSASLVTLGLVLTLATALSPSDRASAAGAKCAYPLRYLGIRYVHPWNLPSAVHAPARERLGQGTIVGCADGSPDRIVEIRRLGKASARTAVVASGRIYVEPGRCAGFSKVPEFLGCAESPLLFGGREFVPTRLPTAPDRSGGLGVGRQNGRRVTVVRVSGVAPTNALAVRRAGQARTIFVAHGKCRVPDPADLFACLRAGTG